MHKWTRASQFEKLQFQSISLFLRPDLVIFLFNLSEPKLNASPEETLVLAKGFCYTDRILIKLAVDIWCGFGGVSIMELLDLDPEVFNLVLRSLSMLRLF